jgi:hypothetical protein
MAAVIWVVMAVIGCAIGALCSIKTLVIITGIVVLFGSLLAWAISREYGLSSILGILWWAGMLLIPMWLLALIRWII